MRLLTASINRTNDSINQCWFDGSFGRSFASHFMSFYFAWYSLCFSILMESNTSKSSYTRSYFEHKDLIFQKKKKQVTIKCKLRAIWELLSRAKWLIGQENRCIGIKFVRKSTDIPTASDWDITNHNNYLIQWFDQISIVESYTCTHRLSLLSSTLYPFNLISPIKAHSKDETNSKYLCGN